MRVANPGCFATAVQLALAPLISNDLIEGPVFVDAKTGSSGSGAAPKESTHHPFRHSSFYAYKLLNHQHQGEILQTFKDLGMQQPENFVMQTHSLPIVRGIFVSAYGSLKVEAESTVLPNLYAEYYSGNRFIRFCDGSPNVGVVQKSNFVDIGIQRRDRVFVVFCALDNLVKGAAGQAIQNYNIMNGWSEDAGLSMIGGYP